MLPSVFPVYKPLGATPLETLHKLTREYPELSHQKLAYAGRLDPMAEGILLVLVGEECKKREDYQKLSKTYTVDVLFGFTTDTYDLLGMLTSQFSAPFPADFPGMVSHATEALLGKQLQSYPPYSSARVKGKPLFYWARENRLDEIVIPHKQIEITRVACVSQTWVSGGELLQTIRHKISLVTGDFRQKEILSAWQAALAGKEASQYPIGTLTIESSQGAYMRSIAHTLGQKLQTGGLAYSIQRMSVGNYTEKDALMLSGTAGT